MNLSAEAVALLRAAVRSGGLFDYAELVELERDEWQERGLWIRPSVSALLKPGRLPDAQRFTVMAALKRFVVGGRFTVVTAKVRDRQVTQAGDFRELKTAGNVFIEMRFRPPPHHLRIFGRFIDRDALVLTSEGSKRADGQTSEIPLSVPKHRLSCNNFFESVLRNPRVPNVIRECMSKADYFDER